MNTNGVEGMWSALKRFYNGRYGSSRMDRHLKDFEFRWNTGGSIGAHEEHFLAILDGWGKLAAERDVNGGGHDNVPGE